MKQIALSMLILLLSVSLFACANGGNGAQSGNGTQPGNGAQSEKDKEAVTRLVEDFDSRLVGSIAYENTQYGFSFSLPQSWKGYSIVTGKWEGLAAERGSQGDKIVETVPMISIRHPQWTAQNQRQDIPIMIFTIAQWESLQWGDFHIGAAPIGPSELGRNTEYIFALPARYNYAFPTGYEEVEKILQSNPLQPNKITR